MNHWQRILALAVAGALLAGLGLLKIKPALPASTRVTESTRPRLGSDNSASVVWSPVVASAASLTVPLVKQITQELRSGSDRDRAYQELLPRLIAQDAPAAARLAEGWERGEQRTLLLQEVARMWSDQDIAAALTWLGQLETSPDRARAIDAAANQIGRTDAAGALELGPALQTGTNDGMLEHRLQLWTEETPAEAVAWVKARPPGRQQDCLLARAAYVRVQSNPAEAMDLLQLMNDDPANAAVTRSVVRLWQIRDPAGANAWVAQNRR